MRYTIKNLAPAITVGNLNLVRALGGNDFPVILATSVANKKAFYSRYYDEAFDIPGPTQSPEKFIDSLLSIGEKYQDNKPVLFYDGDADLLCIIRNREKLSKYYSFNIPPTNVIEAIMDKSTYWRYSNEMDLPGPKTYIQAVDNTVDSVCFDFPVIVKPISRVDWFSTELSKQFGRGGKAIRVNDRVELNEILELCKEHQIEIIIQELIVGPESNIFSYHSYVNKAGTLLAEFTGRKHRTYPNEYGMSTCVEVCELPAVKRLGREVLEKTGLIGVSKLDFKLDDKTGELLLMEINPRFSIWNYPGAEAGINLPVAAYHDLAMDDQGKKYYFKKRVKWIDAKRDRQHHLEQGKIFRFYLLNIPINILTRTVYDVWKISDPGPYFYQIFSFVGRAVNKLKSCII